MKTRSGFVSNSSSSSFIAVGISRYENYPKQNEKFCEAVKALTGKNPDDLEWDDLEPLWNWSGVCEKEGIYMYTNDCEPFFIGMDIEEGILKDKRLSELKKECKKLFKENLNMTISVKDLEFRNDECSSG